MSISKDAQIDFIQCELDKEFEALHHAEMCVKSIKASIDSKTRRLDAMMANTSTCATTADTPVCATTADASVCATTADAPACIPKNKKIMFHYGSDLPPPRSGFKRFKMEFKVKVDATLSTPKILTYGVNDAVEIFAANGEIRNQIRVLLSDDWKRQIDNKALHFFKKYPLVWQIPYVESTYIHWIWVWAYLAN